MLQTTDIRDDLAVRHRRCLPGLARLRMAADQSSPDAGADQITAALGEVLNELRVAERILIGSHADRPRHASVTRFLTCRLRRLEVVADDVQAAAAAGDTATYRRLLYQFRALAAAMWKVQLSVCDPDRPAPDNAPARSRKSKALKHRLKPSSSRNTSLVGRVSDGPPGGEGP